MTHLADLSAPHERRRLVLLPSLDGCRVDEEGPEVVQREDADGDDDGDASRVVEDEHDDLERRRRDEEVERVERVRRDHPKVVGAGDVNVEKEADKVAIVVVSDTVVHPWT